MYGRTLSIILLYPLLGFSSNLVEKNDEFSSGKIYTVSIAAKDNSNAALIVGCFPQNKLVVHLFSSYFMSPDDVVDGNMKISITYKFENTENANTSLWGMNFRKYNDAWYLGDSLNFIQAAINAKTLSIRLDRSSDIYSNW